CIDKPSSTPKECTYNVVSVITDNWSDDTNGELIPSNKCWFSGFFYGLSFDSKIFGRAGFTCFFCFLGF
ncbi:MAG: hypothetical protein QE277_11570, partial [Flectobacillus sp.]|nr:hypothetical protein [Flectobacillus sp.]